MKQLTALVCALILGAAITTAQSRLVNESFSVSGDQRIVLDLNFGDEINIESWNKNEVSFKAVIKVNGGKLNDILEVEYNESSSRLYIETDFDKKDFERGRRQDCPSKGSHSHWNSGNGSYICSEIYYTIYVPEGADLKVETISSDIELKGVFGDLYAKSISGFVDLTWDENHGADIKLKTVSGDAFTDLETMSPKGGKSYSQVGIDLDAKINGGGKRLNLETISGDIYLRKKN
ncbi:MAG: hypothetical protein FH748_16630 [Balneolaceae bacterium]|nr:hypothetical protein [Balneolaceae bacterium]